MLLPLPALLAAAPCAQRESPRRAALPPAGGGGSCARQTMRRSAAPLVLQPARAAHCILGSGLRGKRPLKLGLTPFERFAAEMEADALSQVCGHWLSTADKFQAPTAPQ